MERNHHCVKENKHHFLLCIDFDLTILTYFSVLLNNFNAFIGVYLLAIFSCVRKTLNNTYPTGIQNASPTDRGQPATVSPPHTCAASAKILRPTPIRPHAKGFSRHPPQTSIAYQGRLLAVVDVSPPAPAAFVPPPPPLPPPPHLSITPPLAFMPSYPQTPHHVYAHLPPLQCITNPHHLPGDPLGVPALQTPPPVSPEGGNSSEEEHHAAGEEYLHKKLRFSRKLRQVEVEQLCSASQEMPRD